MKAFLLAAGFGTRLRPLTNTVPKCLIPIQGKALMEWWLELFAKHGISEVLVNTHYLAESVRDFISGWNIEVGFPMVTEFFEETLLGSGGTVAANRSFIGNDEEFLICYADNLTDVDLGAFQKFHKTHNGVLSMGLFHTGIPEQCGIAALDDTKQIIEFEEKPLYPKSNLANAGIYIARQELFHYLPKTQGLLDFGKDVLPKLVGKMYGWEISDYLLDIGTLENYEKAKKEWHK
ncbi:MAG: nucleotidyltransferase family protein [Clostridia bacterium]|nr:nucleotidyltransferase family protein [Clostridia bacterium]